MPGETRSTRHPLIGDFRHATLTVKILACAVILAFGGLVTTPAVAAIRKEIKTHPWRTERSNPAAKLSVTLHDLHRRLAQFAVAPIKPTAAAATQAAQKTAAVPASERTAVRHYLDKLRRLDGQVRAQFAATYAHLKHHHLPTAILQREQVAQKKYHVRMAALMQALKTASQAPNVITFHANLVAASEQLDRHLVKPPHEKFDPRHLPFAVAKNRHIKPRLTRRAYARHPVIQGKITPMARSASAMTQQATPAASVPANPNDPSYLAPTVDVQLTATIKAKAAALDHNPVKIFNWVHNHIEYIPTYGSIQGAAQTLSTLRGNDFDTASLLIALLRASGIPARYVYGTIRVPIGEVENWVGGVSDPNAALNLLGQGGIPATGLVQGGQIKYVQMEHVWVEAWINYLPARGSKSGPGNTWVPLDASFKQYTYQDGMNLKQAVPFDTQAFTQHLTDTATVNKTDGWVRGVDQAYIQTQLGTYQQQVKDFINNQDPGTTVGDVLGSKIIVQRTPPTLAASLPYHLVAVGNRMAALPDSLRWKFTYKLEDGYGDPVMSYTAATPALAGKDLALSFHATSAADATTIASYFPQIPPGGTIDPSQLPHSLPGYLIHLTPEISLNGRSVVSQGSYALGTELHAQEGYWSPQDGWQLKISDLTTGEYHAVGLDLQGIAQDRLDALRAHLAYTQAELQSGDVSNLTGRDLTGTILQAGALSYFAINGAQDILVSRENNVVQYREPSFGTFKTTVQAVYSFGIPQSVGISGVTMNIEYYKTSAVAKDDDPQKKVHYYLAIGPRLSAFEHIVPEQIFSTVDQPVHGVSAVKALAIAASQGQKIYTITAGNISTALPQLTISDEIKSKIRDAVNAGDQVTVSQDPISYAGWKGAGYIITDPTTGTGAYKISGGADGGAVIKKTGDPLDLFGDFLSIIGAAQSVSSFFAKIGYEIGKFKFSDYATVFKDAGNLLVGVSAAITAITVWTKTGSLWKTAASGAIDLVLTLIAGFVAQLLFDAVVVAFIGGPIAAVIITVAIAIVMTLLENELFKYLFNVTYLLPFRWRNKYV